MLPCMSPPCYHRACSRDVDSAARRASSSRPSRLRTRLGRERFSPNIAQLAGEEPLHIALADAPPRPPAEQRSPQLAGAEPFPDGLRVHLHHVGDLRHGQPSLVTHAPYLLGQRGPVHTTPARPSYHMNTPNDTSIHPIM